MTSKTDDMMKVLHSMAWKFNRPELQLELVQEGALAWLKSEAKGEDRGTVEAWEAMNDFVSSQGYPVTIPMHEGTRTALKKIRSNQPWEDTDYLDQKSFDSLATVVGGLAHVADEITTSSVESAESSLFFSQVRGIIRAKLGDKYSNLFELHYGEMGYTLQEVSDELGLGLSLVKKMNRQIKDLVRASS